MKSLRYIAVLSLALYGFWAKQNNAVGRTPDHAMAYAEFISDTTEPSISPDFTGDSTKLFLATNTVLADSSEDDTEPPVSASAASLEPAGDLYDDWDTTSVHAEKFDALTFNDTVRIPLNDPGHCNYVHPFNGPTTSGFAFRSYRYHFGVDINLETGDTVRCAFDGKVRIAQRSKTYGFVVVIRHNNGLETYYAHLSKLLVKPGEDMEAGMVLGLGGNTGHSFGSHLHFEMRFRGVAIDPTYLIDFKTQALRTDTYNLTKSDFKYLAEQYKVRHYSRKKKKTWYTYYCPGGARYSTPEAKSIMAKVPYPTMPGTPPTAFCSPDNNYTTVVPRENPVNNSSAQKNATTQKKPAANSTKTQVREPIGGTPAYYSVKSGDSLYAIALKYHTTVTKLCALNGIKEKGVLSVGKKLRVK
ncbi:MAG: peptidoglycan DD-metalloendopeptidase family protein [Bacteroidetes bacterium]|nr:peptidoglycan DD-metalloendopeptidase family protein [Bacteroidota bacterium]